VVSLAGVLVVLGALLAAGALGLWLRRSGPRLSEGASTTEAAQAPAPHVLGPAELGSQLGRRATLVQFSTSFCAPCRSTRQLLDRASLQIDGVRHVEVDAEANLDLVRRLDIRRTPTVLVLDAAGRVVRRASGQPRYADVVAAIGAAVASRSPGGVDT
jgi:thiol-disulfide isomerase/thioredoxin